MIEKANLIKIEKVKTSGLSASCRRCPKTILGPWVIQEIKVQVQKVQTNVHGCKLGKAAEKRLSFAAKFLDWPALPLLF
ncbi:MAG: hypothetical protein EAZ62_00990 [Sphingobacteriia bacterium]|nr:MAG: hypothetical protein EAZ62_00990 [Sphingobacteriia bacterium]